VSGHKLGLLPGRCHHSGFPLQQLPAVDEGPLAFGQGGFRFLQRKVSLSILTNFSFLGMIWGPTKGSLGQPWVELERLHGQAPLFLSFRFHLAVWLWS
jgi:hypothetical protein